MHTQVNAGPGQVAEVLVGGFVVTLAALYAGTQVVPVGAPSAEQLVLAAVTVVGLNAAVRIVGVPMTPGGRALVGLAARWANVWVLKSILAATGGSAAVVWAVATAITLVVAFTG